MPKRLTDKEKFWREISEKGLQSAFMQEARGLGWMVFHFSDSRKMVRRGSRYIPVGDPDAKGLPDLIMCHPRWGVVFIEVKKELGKLEPEQEEARNALLAAGAKWYLLRPSTQERLSEGLAKGFEAI
jgi:hypothetical protein